MVQYILGDANLNGLIVSALQYLYKFDDRGVQPVDSYSTT